MQDWYKKPILQSVKPLLVFFLILFLSSTVLGWIGGGGDATCNTISCNLSDDDGYLFTGLDFTGTTGFSDGVDNTAAVDTAWFVNVSWTNYTLDTELQNFPFASSLPNITMQQINDSIGNWSQFLETYANIDTDSTDDLSLVTIISLDLVNGSYVNTSIINHNESIKAYIDAQDILANSSIKVYIDAQDISANSSIKVYIDAQDILANSSMKVYVDEQDLQFPFASSLPNITMQEINDSVGNHSQYLITYPNIDTDSTDDLSLTTVVSLDLVNGSYVNISIIAHNASIKSYIDEQDSAIQNFSIVRNYNTSWFSDSILWESSTGKVKLKSPQDVNMQNKNISNVSSVGFPNMTIKKIDTNSDVNGTAYGYYMDGQTGVNMPHFWIQPGGAGQASGISRSFMITNELAALQNTINITDCQAFQDKLEIPRNRQIDCNTTTTGADLIVGDDFISGGDIVLKDSDGEYHDISRDLQITDEMNRNITLVGLNGTLDSSTGNVTITTLTGENIVVNIDKNESILDSNTDSIIITSGTNASPILNQIVYVNSINPTLSKRTSLTLRAPSVGAFLQGANFTYVSAIGLATIDHFIGGLFNRFLRDGATYGSGFDINVSTDMVNISTGVINFLLSEIEIISNHSTSDLYVHIHSDGSFDQHLALDTCSNYNDGSAIGNNKYYSAVFGIAITHDGAGVMYVVTQDRPSTEYTKAIDAEVDIENTINFFPPDDIVSLAYIPIVRVIMKRSGGANTIQTLSNGLLFDDLRGTVTKTSSSPPPSGITAHSDLSNLDYASAGHTGFVSTDGLVNETIIRADNITWIRDQFISSSNITYDSTTGSFSYNGTVGEGTAFDPSDLSYVNTTMLQNFSIIRATNISWILANQYTPTNKTYTGSANISVSSDDIGIITLNMTCEQMTGGSGLCDGTDDTSAFDPSDLGYVNITMLQNFSVVRDYNTSWVTDLISSGDGNLTYSSGVFKLTVVDLAELDNSNSAFITSSALITYALAVSLPNITMQEINDSIGNWSQWLETYPNVDTDGTDDLSLTSVVLLDLVNGSYVNISIRGHNASQTAYTDAQDILANSSMKVYVDAQDISANDSIKPFIKSIDSNASTACSGTTTYLDGEGTCDDISTVYVQASDWTTHDNYATGCTNQFVVDIDDTLTCASVDSADIGSVLLSDLSNDIFAITNKSDADIGLLNVSNNLFVNSTNVGIGTSSPIFMTHLVEKGVIGEASAVFTTDALKGRTFMVQGDGAAYLAGRDVTSNSEFAMGVSGAAGNPIFVGSMTSNDLSLRTSNNEKMIIKDDTGNVGINTSAPSSKLHVAGNITIQELGGTALSGIWHNGSGICIAGC